MDIFDYIDRRKPQLLEHIKQQCKDIQQDHLPYSKEIGDKLYEYTSRGKLLRGIFVCLGAESFGALLNPEILLAAAALEVAQSSILIHDDVMDQDDIRRGKSSIHKIYKEEGFSHHAANSLAICLGDVGLFHFFQYLTPDIYKLFSQELCKTAIGQTYDVMQAASSKELSQEEIMLIIQYKTANYTFTLPLLAGLILSGKYSVEYQQKIRELSDIMGFIFQVRDDELNYLPTQQTGKSVGGDIRENKKTLCRLFLVNEYPELKELYGQDGYIEKVQEYYQQSNAKKEIGEMITSRMSIAKGILHQLPIQNEYNEIWCTLLEYIYTRKF